MQFITSLPVASSRPAVATIGFFDGVHLGHCFLIEQVKRYAAQRGMQSLLITFDKHPRQVMQADYRPALLSTLEEKKQLLQTTQADACAVLPFTPELAALSAREFMQQVLHEGLGVKVLVIGYDHRFGCGRTDGFEDYVRYGRELGMEVVQATACTRGGVHVSSSVIRSLLAAGEVQMAAQCLGHPYVLSGKVVKGFRVGRELGFPTANLSLNDSLKLVPGGGVYAVRVQGEGVDNLPGMLNVGCRPTIDNGSETSVEVHVLDFAGDLYEKHLMVSFYKRLRDEKRFRSRAELVNRLQVDAEEVKKFFQSQGVE